MINSSLYYTVKVEYHRLFLVLNQYSSTNHNCVQFDNYKTHLYYQSVCAFLRIAEICIPFCRTHMKPSKEVLVKQFLFGVSHTEVQVFVYILFFAEILYFYDNFQALKLRSPCIKDKFIFILGI